jgi:outer membrane protein
MKRIIFLLIVVALSTTIFAQSGIKLGHINSQELLQAMPESDSAQAKLDKAVKELQSQLEAMQVEFNNKYQDHVGKKDTYSELIRKDKEADLQQMNQRIQQFQANAEQDIQKQRTEIFKPVLDKANKAVSDVAKENGFTYIFDLSGGTVIFHSDNSINILPMVKLKLGLK